MTTHFRFVLESRAVGARTWEATSHSTSVWEFVPKMMEDAERQQPSQEWRIVGQLVTTDEGGNVVTKKGAVPTKETENNY